MSAHKNILQTSDFIIYTVTIFALILEWLLPSSLNIERVISVGIGVFMIILSWVIIFTAKYQFKKYNQKSGPNNETTEIIKDGLFAHTRNPIYLGVIFLAPALGLIVNSIWLIFSIVPVCILIHFFLIIPEERYLKNKFKDDYVRYCTQVRRWI